MIIRVWKGSVLRERADDYIERMRQIAIPDYRATPGNLGAFCSHALRGLTMEIRMTSFWRDLDAVKAFAGADHDAARYYDFDAGYLLWQDDKVEHMTLSAGALDDEFQRALPHDGKA